MRKAGEEFLLSTLTHKNPHVTVNLYFEMGEGIELFVKGNGIVHAIGFFEPEPKLDHLDEVELHHLHEKLNHLGHEEPNSEEERPHYLQSQEDDEEEQ